MLKKIKYRIEILSKLIPFTYGVKRFLLLNLIINLAIMSLSFINPLIYRAFIDDIVLGGRFERINFIIIGYLLIFFITVIFGYVKNYSNNRLINRAVFKSKSKILHNYCELPFSDYENSSVGDMKMKLEDDTSTIGVFVENQTISYLISYIRAGISLIFLIIIDWRLTLFAIISIPVTFWLDNIISKREKILNNSNRENDQNMSSWLHASIQGWREIKALNLEISQKRQLARFLHKFALYFGKWINYWVARTLIIPKIKDEFFMQFGIYFIGGLLIMNGNLKIGSLFVFIMYYGMLSGSVKTVSGSDAELQSVMPIIHRWMSEIEKIKESEKTMTIIPDNSNIIEFENVSFKYSDNGKEIFNNFNLRIDKGERIAIIGKSGCGKTTLLKLLVGMVTPTSGNVFFAGINLSEIDISAMHRRIGFVMQENMLFNTSIKENLLYGKSIATDNDLIIACEKTYILDFIESLPNKFDTVIGERGIKLSGGQQQRLVLARLFLRDVDIFIFDEATNALDQYSENIVHDAIRNIGKDKTIIIVAHRDSSINLCDRKITLDSQN